MFSHNGYGPGTKAQGAVGRDLRDADNAAALQPSPAGEFKKWDQKQSMGNVAEGNRQYIYIYIYI